MIGRILESCLDPVMPYEAKAWAAVRMTVALQSLHYTDVACRNIVAGDGSCSDWVIDAVLGAE